MQELHTPRFHLARTLSCAQAFRWQAHEGGFIGVAQNRPLYIQQDGDTIGLDCALADLPFWTHYFDFTADYAPLEALLAQDALSAPCLQTSAGIRILRQQPYETLISFILSANNNAKRIAGLVEALCLRYGEPIAYRGQKHYAFPSPQALAQAEVDDLRALGLGYRAPFVRQSAAMVAQGFDLEALRHMPFAQAKKALCTFSGVGPKVAECVMLFSLGFDSAFPVDVWVERIVQVLQSEGGKDGAMQCAMRYGNWAGAAQQYLFHYARIVGLGKKQKATRSEETTRTL